MAIRQTELYDEVLDAMPIDPDGIMSFRLPKELQSRVSKLASRNSAGKLSREEHFELQKLLALEATMRALKANALQTKWKSR